MNSLYPTQQQAQTAERGTIHLVICRVCGFVFNSAFDPTLTTYTTSYDNSQSYSPYFQTYIDNQIHDLVNQCQVRDRHIIEIGCGDGYFLRRLTEAGNNEGIGFDPSYKGPASDAHLLFKAQYYDASTAAISTDVLICRHVLEHIADPVAFLATIHHSLRRSLGARIFFETPCFQWIIEHQAWWDIYYEHCNYFTQDTLRRAFELAGFRIVQIRHVFEGQYLWAEAVLADRTPGAVVPVSQTITVPSLEHETQFCQHWTEILQTLHTQYGPIALIGAAGKGVTFANLIDPSGTKIACVVDVNPHKQHKFLPGTGHPIVSYADLATYDVRAVIVMNMNYAEEIQHLLTHLELQIPLIDHQGRVLQS